MQHRTVSQIFDEVLAGSDAEALLPQIAALSPNERATLVEALEHVEAQAACEGRGQHVQVILKKFGDSRRR